MAVSEPTDVAFGTGWCGGYRPQPGVYDEMCTDASEVRDHWRYLVGALGKLGSQGLEGRWREAARLLRDNGVTYNVFGDSRGMSRPWELDLLPLLVQSEEWTRIERGLTQRAEVLNQLLLDLYGPRKLMRKGLLPPDFVFSHPGFLLPCDGIYVSGDRPLTLYAADLTRDPDGSFRVLSDRTQTPSGVGYALENRIVLSRVLPSLFRDSHVHRLAGFFRSLRASLIALAPKPNESIRVVLLSPGPSHEAYFEHAYLANYLGYTLVQGGDLTVRDQTLWLKTLDGLERVDVVLRRVDDDFCDPLELNDESLLGVPGLVQAVRARNVALANGLGTGILEHPGLGVFLPAICKALLGEDLLLPGVQTWWCGNPVEREFVLANLHRLVVRPTAHGGNCQFGADMTQEGLSTLRSAIRDAPHGYVAQDPVSLSTAPVVVDGRTEPRSTVIRAFLVTDDRGYEVMPGGLTRVATKQESLRVSHQLGGIGKDTWLLASEPEREDTLIPSAEALPAMVRSAGEVSSRVADNLFWIGRYAERAESLVRLLRIIVLKLTERWGRGASKEASDSLSFLLRALTSQTLTFPGFVGDGADERLLDPQPELLSLMTDDHRVGGLPQTLRAMGQAAWSVRDRLSVDTWRVVNDIEVQHHALITRPPTLLADALDELDPLVTAIVAFSALTKENMTHSEGWHFLEAGRRLERGVNTANLLRSTLVRVVSENEESLIADAVLSVMDSLITYRRRYQQGSRVMALLDLLFQDETNPRSLAFQVMRLTELVAAFPRPADAAHNLSHTEKLALEALTEVRLADLHQLAAVAEGAQNRELLGHRLDKIGRLLPALSDSIAAVYFRHEERPHPLALRHDGKAS